MEEKYRIHMEPSREEYFEEGQILKFKVGPKEGKYKVAELDLSEEDFRGILGVFEPQYIYIIKEETPELDDICIFPNGLIARYSHPMDGEMMHEAQKIVASDNPDIVDEYNKIIIPISFAEDYAEVLNEGHDIEIYDVYASILSSNIEYKIIKK